MKALLSGLRLHLVHELERNLNHKWVQFWQCFFRCFVCNIPAYAAPPPSVFQYFSIVRFLVSAGVNNNCRCPCRTIFPKRFLFFVHFLFTLYMMYWIRMTNNNTIASETTRMSNKLTIIIDFHPSLLGLQRIL